MKRYSEAMATIPSLTATCPICDAVIEIKDFEPEIEEPITCPECDNDLDWEIRRPGQRAGADRAGLG